MKKLKLIPYTLLLFLLGSLLFSCAKEETASIPAGEETTLEIGFTVKEEGIITRSLNVLAVQHVNIFLFGRDVPQRYHTTVSGSVSYNLYKSTLPVMPGSYDLYIVGNVSGLTGQETKEQLEAMILTYDGPSIDGYTPMSGKSTVTVASGQANSATVELERAIVFVAYYITNNMGCSLSLDQVSICNVPDRYSLFCPTEDQVHPDGVQYQDYLLSSDFCTSMGSSVYLPENRQGARPGITDEKQRGKAMAPENATYLRVRGIYQGNPLYYDIYLGENSTSDFNVRRNTQMEYTAYINGVNTADLRVQQYGNHSADYVMTK